MTVNHLLTLPVAIITLISFCSACAQVEECEPDNLKCMLAPYENDGYNDLHSVIVIQNGELIEEHYLNGGNSNTLVDVRSAGKSVTSLLFGIALDNKAIESLNDPVDKYWPEAIGTDVGKIRLQDLLTMRSGLDADSDDPKSAGNEDKMDGASDPLSFALSVPSKSEPGKQYRYNSHAAYVTGVVVGRATGKGLEGFARKNLFEPLNIQRFDWQKDRAGQTKGQGNLFLTALDFARIGELVLNDGVYKGQQIVSSEWIKQSLKPWVDVSESESNANGYGYYWFHQDYQFNDRSIEVYFASGNGGNKIYLVPEFDMVVSIMSQAYGQGRGQRRSEEILKTIISTPYYSALSLSTFTGSL